MSAENVSEDPVQKTVDVPAQAPPPAPPPTPPPKDEDKETRHVHSHTRVNLAFAIFGGILILNSFLAKLFYEDPFLGDLSAVAGAVLLAVPIIGAAIGDARCR